MGTQFLYKDLLSANTGDQCCAGLGFTAGSSEAVCAGCWGFRAIHAFCDHGPLFLACSGPCRVGGGLRAKLSPQCGFMVGWDEVVRISALVFCWAMSRELPRWCHEKGLPSVGEPGTRSQTEVLLGASLPAAVSIPQ